MNSSINGNANEVGQTGNGTTTAVAPTPDSEVFWNKLREEGRWCLQRCVVCRRVQFYPTSVCARCWARDLEWIECPPEGTLIAVSEVYRAPAQQFRDELPYRIGVVLLLGEATAMCRVTGEASAGADGTVDVTQALNGSPLLTFHPSTGREDEEGRKHD